VAASLARGLDVHAATDVTGFALLGHTAEMATLSGVRIDLRFASLPLLPGAADYAGQWLFPAGTNHNEAAFAGRIAFAGGIADEQRLLLFTPETSGGLLLAMPPEAASTYLSRCRQRGVAAWNVGTVAEGEGTVSVT
ncbi:MAG: AIR synthase-related protein, partial [Anaerolineae bacterium]